MGGGGAKGDDDALNDLSYPLSKGTARKKIT